MNVTFKALRDGKEKNFTVALAELPEDVAVRKANDSAEPSVLSSADSFDGVEIADLDSEARRRYDIPARIRGALVTKVDEDSTAAEAGLRPGDVIVEINRQPVKSADDAVELTRDVKTKRLLLRVFNQSGGVGATRYLSVQAGKK